MVSFFFHPLAAHRPPSNAPLLSGAENPSKQSCSPLLVHAKQFPITRAHAISMVVSLISRTPFAGMEQAGQAAVMFLTSCGEKAACG